MSLSKNTYPNRSDYDQAVKYLKHFILDPVLKNGEATRKGPLVAGYSGSFSKVYPIKTAGATWALRCWIKDVGQPRKRYYEVDRYMKSSRLPYYVDFHYLEDGIIVNENTYPILRMTWVDGPTLFDYIKANKENQSRINQVASAFLIMVQDLHRDGVSHGDLQPENIMVDEDESGPVLRLIDYDSFYVPALKNLADSVAGLPAYQHPSRIKQPPALVLPMEARDYFSELVIYLSLKAIAEDPGLMDENQDASDKKLIFSDSDFLNPHDSTLFSTMAHMSMQVQRYAGHLYRYCLDPTMESFVPLEELAHQNIKNIFATQWEKKPQNQTAPRTKAFPAQPPANRGIPSITPGEANSEAEKPISWVVKYPFFNPQRSPTLRFFKNTFGRAGQWFRQRTNPSYPAPTPIPVVTPEPNPTGSPNEPRRVPYRWGRNAGRPNPSSPGGDQKKTVRIQRYHFAPDPNQARETDSSN